MARDPATYRRTSGLRASHRVPCRFRVTLEHPPLLSSTTGQAHRDTPPRPLRTSPLLRPRRAVYPRPRGREHPPCSRRLCGRGWTHLPLGSALWHLSALWAAAQLQGPGTHPPLACGACRAASGSAQNLFARATRMLLEGGSQTSQTQGVMASLSSPLGVSAFTAHRVDPVTMWSICGARDSHMGGERVRTSRSSATRWRCERAATCAAACVRALASAPSTARCTCDPAPRGAQGDACSLSARNHSTTRPQPHTHARIHTNTRAHVHTSHGTGRSAGATPRHTRRGRPAPTAGAANGPRQERGARACPRPRQPPRPVPHPHSTHPPTTHLRWRAGEFEEWEAGEVGGREKAVLALPLALRSALGQIIAATNANQDPGEPIYAITYNVICENCSFIDEEAICCR